MWMNGYGFPRHRGGPMHYARTRGHAEIADHLDISVTAAKVRLHRGRKELRSMLREWKDGA